MNHDLDFIILKFITLQFKPPLTAETDLLSGQFSLNDFRKSSLSNERATKTESSKLRKTKA